MSLTPKGHSRPRIGVSMCLLGHEVRYDGGHTRDQYVESVLGAHVDFVSMCPEVDVGMGTPRPSVRLVRAGDTVRMISAKEDYDWTEQMETYSKVQVDQLAKEPLDGFVLKKNSPSCGAFRIKVFDNNDVPSRDGRGLFAAELMRRFPRLPVEEDGRLNDSRLRENFVTRVFAYHRLHAMRAADPTPGKLQEFHARHKYLLLAHSPKHYYELGPLVANARTERFETLIDGYEQTFMDAIAKPAPVKRHVNVLHHFCGFLKQELDPAGKQELLDVIESSAKAPSR